LFNACLEADEGVYDVSRIFLKTKIYNIQSTII